MSEKLPPVRSFTRRKLIAAGLGLVGLSLGGAALYDTVTAPKEEGSSAYSPGTSRSVLPKDEAIREQNRLTNLRNIIDITGILAGFTLLAYSYDELFTE